MRIPKLSPEETANRLAALPGGWSVANDTLSRQFVFADFVAAIKFVNRLADAAEAADHHPDLDIRHNKVTVSLSTHDSGGLTEKDFALAGAANGFVE